MARDHSLHQNREMAQIQSNVILVLFISFIYFSFHCKFYLLVINFVICCATYLFSCIIYLSLIYLYFSFNNCK